MMEVSFKKTRIAPTPSGYLHLGNVLSFALTAALARRTGASMLLRIDDMDKTRAGPEYVQDIFDTLNFLEICWDEGPRTYAEFEREFSQVHRMGLYQEALQQLRTEGKLFACGCSRTTILRDSSDGGYPGTCRNRGLPFDGADTSWRLSTGGVGGGPATGGVWELPTEMRDFIVRKKDGFPAYQLVSLIDDLHYGIDLVVRGEDLGPSTLAQRFLARQLGRDAFGKVLFYHHPLLKEPDGGKMSKSAGSASIRYLRGQGFKPSDIYSMIARMTGKDFQAGSWQELVAGLDEDWVPVLR